MQWVKEAVLELPSTPQSLRSYVEELLNQLETWPYSHPYSSHHEIKMEQIEQQM